MMVYSSFKPQEDSELTLLMRSMADEMKLLKASVLQDQLYTDWKVDYKQIHTAKPSTEAKKGPKFSEYARVFIAQLDRLKENKTTTEIRPQYNLLVNSCIQCHETFCPGPLSMLKKLRVPEPQH
jgi:hypothetical protein